MPGPLHRFFAADHDRLDALLKRSISRPGTVDLSSFGEFRAGILRHIGMEEKVLFPAGRHLHQHSPHPHATGEPFAIAAKLRVDHGAIAALLVPTPTPEIVADLLSVLVPHNRREEEAAGIYGLCDTALGAEAAERLIEQLRAFPEPPLKPYNDGPGVMKHVAETLAASRRQWL